MPVQIDHMETTVELTAPTPASGGGAGERRSPTGGAQAGAPIREVVGRILAEELDRFMRTRGL